MADLSGDRRGLIPAHNPANQLNPCFRQNVSRKLLLTSIAVTHLAFLEQSLVAVRKRSEKSNGSPIGSLAYLVANMVCGCSAVAMSRLSGCGLVSVEYGPGEHGDQRTRHQKRQRDIARCPSYKGSCMRRAFWKLPNSAGSSENWIGFQIASPK